MAGLSSRTPRLKPTPEQQRAADPNCSVWVTASAGTGKTRVLADRVVRLLLAGVEPGRILALTFTKAGASEMVTRIQGDLGRLATWPEPLLTLDLKRLLRATPSEQQIRRARTLLPEVLDLPAGLPVMTIHSFCQALLKRFPLEAAVPLGFDVLDVRDQADLLGQGLHQVLGSGHRQLQETIARLAVVLGEFGLKEGLAALNEHRFRLGAAIEGHEDLNALARALAGRLDLPDALEPPALRLAVASDPTLDEAALRAAVRDLAAGSQEDARKSECIAWWLDLDAEGRAEGLGDYQAAFFTSQGDPRKRLASKTVLTPALEVALCAEQSRLAAWRERLKAATVLERTRVILDVGVAVMERYAALKQRAGALDYDDLILATKSLLAGAGVASWVNYKLDRRIDHLLVDESQDTSPEQWAIVLALAEEFFSGEGAGSSGRTLFVVGDEKQSIFSFQGADLATFRAVHGRVSAQARAACAPWREEPLHRSFRCAPPVLEAVDAVFASAGAGDGVVGPQGIRHESADPRAAGIVELWPLVPAPERETGAEAWALPDAQERSERPEHRLASLIARQVFEWRRDEIRLPGEKRAIRPGDVMILLPRRGILQDLIIRELKQLNVPVAGADRLALVDELAVMDLMALGDAVLLPEDDLTFAALLRSPLFELGEEQLFQLAHGRGRTPLFARLRAFAGDDRCFAAALGRFEGLRAAADLLPPYEFYARHLAEGGGRARLERRLGRGAREPIEAFLAQALAYERTHPPSLQGFLQWLRADTSELVRDPDQPRDEVRVLTVHGAKGLEAPIVIIADATFVPEAKDRLLWREEDGLPLWKVGRHGQDPVSRQAAERARERQLQEQRRLLYVAMTRARTWLIVTGWERRRAQDESWYDHVRDGLERLPASERVAMPAGSGLDGEALRHSNLPSQASTAQRLPLGAPRAPEPPSPPWLTAAAPDEPAVRSPLSPSRLGDEEPPTAPPVELAGGGRFARGRIVHRLLQTLPDLPAHARGPALERYLAQPGLALGEEERRGLRREILTILEMPGLAPLFGAHSRAEVPIAGRLGEDLISGQIDRLAITPEEVLLLDYKTDRSPPADVAGIPPAYLRQLAAYAALLAQLYPRRPVRAGLLWTAGPELMLLDARDLLPHLPRTPSSALA